MKTHRPTSKMRRLFVIDIENIKGKANYQRKGNPMYELTQTAAETIQANETLTEKGFDLFKEVLDATHDVSMPQAVVVVGAATAITAGACYAFNKICDVIKSGRIKDIDFTNKKVTFSDQPQNAAA